MAYAKVINNTLVAFPWTWEQMRQENPEVLFPDKFVPSIFAEYGGVQIAFEHPTYDRNTHYVVAGEVKLVGNTWTQTYDIVAYTVEELAVQESSKRQANAAKAKLELEESDWCELPSVRNTDINPHLTNSADFDSYRLALRQIVLNPPVEVPNWPDLPDGIWSTAS